MLKRDRDLNFRYGCNLQYVEKIYVGLSDTAVWDRFTNLTSCFSCLSPFLYVVEFRPNISFKKHVIPEAGITYLSNSNKLF